MNKYTYWDSTMWFSENDISIYPDEKGNPIRWVSVIGNNICNIPGQKTITMPSGKKISAWIKDPNSVI